jgi:DNA-directed RNA polymerase specialized sigma24 family protein
MLESQDHQPTQQAKSILGSLLKRALAGDQGAEAELFQTLSLRFTAIAKRRIREKEAAEDIAQDACATILHKYKSESFTVSFAAWAFGVLWMKIGNHLQ